MGFAWTPLVLLPVLAFLSEPPPVRTQELQETDALCNAAGCFVVYFQRKIFLDSWRSCKEMGGDLATVKRREDADAIASLFSAVNLRHSRADARVWIGLQRQPRQCTAARPLRGFSWTTGDQDTQYTNWQREDSRAMCSVPRCVALNYTADEPRDNFKWLDGSCSIPVDGYLCHYAYRGMCPALWSEDGGNPLYATPFNLLSTILTHIPFGSVATIPCPASTVETEPVVCTLRSDGSVGWSRDPPFCSYDPAFSSVCDVNNGGCEHLCRSANGYVFCECYDEYQLQEDGLTCELVDLCRDSPCEFECLVLGNSYRCACPDGYMLKPDGRACEDVNECLQSPCEHLCENTAGSFRCRCRDGYFPDEEGSCRDVDECLTAPCEHNCENTLGSYKCHCGAGFALDPDDPGSCQDVDECQSPGVCEHMCANSAGSYECHCREGYALTSDGSSCVLLGPGSHEPGTTPPYFWLPKQSESEWDVLIYDWSTEQSQTDWPTEREELDWLTDPTSLYDSEYIYVTRSLRDDSDPDDNVNSATQGSVSSAGRDKQAGYPSATPLSLVPPTANPSKSLYWFYEDEDEDEEATTTAPPPLPTSTISEGAWHWWGTTPPLVPDPEKDIASSQQEPGRQHIQTEMSDFPEEEPSENAGTTPPYRPAAPASTPSSPFPPVEDRMWGGDDPDSVDGEQERWHNSTWLLVGLLVPIGVLLVVMVALGIIYCTHCAARPKGKGSSDCYHWISGAHDKSRTPDPSAGIKTQV